jgi:large subunit ribosomal protein L1
MQQNLVEMVKRARERAKRRNFKQAFEIAIGIKPIQLRKQDININEVIQLPNPLPKPSKVCIFAGGDLALRASKAGVDKVVSPEELDRLAANKREARKLSKAYDFFLADVSLMPRIGRNLGPFLGPKGKMPQPVPPTAPVENLISNLKKSVRIRSRGQYCVACKIGDEGMRDEEVAQNALTVINRIERLLPLGIKSIKSVTIKLSMGEPVKSRLEQEVIKAA